MEQERDMEQEIKHLQVHQEMAGWMNNVCEEARKKGYSVVLGVYHNATGMYSTEELGRNIAMMGLVETMRIDLEQHSILTKGTAL